MANGYLYIKVGAEAGEAFSRELVRNFSEGWERDWEWEERHRSRTREPREAYFYVRKGGERKLGVVVFRRDAGTLYVANLAVLAENGGALADEEYNALQRAFQSEVLKTGYLSYIAGESLTLALSWRAQILLDEFIAFANPETGSHHPGDRRRWMEFLTGAHRDNCLPSEGAAAEFFERELGWAREIAGELGLEVEFAKQILDVRFGLA